ncbi:uncharacterized protein RB166_020546 [Leptodactylus fuscus]
MDVPSNNNKAFDGFYNELRRKYPDAFTLATDLGRRNGSLQKLPRLEKTPSPILGFPPNSSPNAASPQRWSPDSFLSKVNYQKTRNEQKKDVEISQPSGNAVIIKDQAIPIPTWTKKEYLEAQNGVSFHLPSLRTQIEQNKVELKNRLNPPKKTETNQSSILQASDSVQGKTSNDHTTTQTTREYTPKQTTREYTPTQTSRDYTTTRDYIPTQTSRDYTTTQSTREYTPTHTSRDYTTTQTTRDYTTTQSTREYTPTQTSRDYTPTQTSRDYTTTQTTREYNPTQTSRDYTTTQITKDYNTTQTPGDYTITKTLRDYPTAQTTVDYTTESTNDLTGTRTTNDYMTPKPTKDYNTTQTTRDYSITKPNRDYKSPQTIREYITTNDYATTKTTNNYIITKPTKDYITTQTTRDYTITKTNKDYTTPQTIRDYTTTNDYSISKSTKGHSTTGNRAPLRPNVSGVKSDPLGTIMKELLPNKPSRLMKDLPKTTNMLPSNGDFVSDSDSGVSVCSPMKVFRSKIRSPQAPPASRDIIKKFSAKPKRSCEPLKADHSLVQENITQIVQIEDNPVTRCTKTPQGPPRARVHFEDESEEDAEFRYQERRLLERAQTTKPIANTSLGPQIKYTERNAKPETPMTSSSPSKEGEKLDQKTMILPHRRQPFPPSVAKQVLIDIPRGGLPSRRMPLIRLSPVMRDITNKQIPPRNGTSLDGITMNFTNTSHERREHNQSIRASSQDERGHNSLSSLETIASGTTEASSEFTIVKMKRGESSSSISSGNQSRSSSQNRDLNLDHTSQSKGAEMSFYNKMRRSLRLKKKPSSESPSDNHHSDFIQKYSKDLEPDQSSYTSIPIDGGVHGKSSPHAAVHRLPNQTTANDSIPSHVNIHRTKKDDMGDVETPSAMRIHPVKVPYSPMRMMQSLLKKGRAKDYLVRAPSPPSQEARPSSSSVHSSRYRREPTPEQSSEKVLAVQSDSNRLVELQRPKMGFSGLYLTKKNQHGYSGLYVVQLSGAFTSSFPQGILEVGDEILEINRLQAKDLRLDEIYTLLEESSCVLLKVSRSVSSSS